MTPAARLQAAIEVLDEVIAAARDNGPPADTIVTHYFKQRRYAGKQGSARGAGTGLPCRPPNGRAAEKWALGGARPGAKMSRSFSTLFGQPRGPEPLNDPTKQQRPAYVPDWFRGGRLRRSSASTNGRRFSIARRSISG